MKRHRVPGTYGPWPPYGKRRKPRRRRPAAAPLGSKIVRAEPPKLRTYTPGDMLKMLFRGKGGERG